MSVFAYRAGMLHVEDVSLAAIARTHGTPCFVYSRGEMVARYRAYRDALSGMDALICYALKANSNQAVIATFAREGAGADIVSRGELARALAAGVPAERIVFSGVGKTEEEMALALNAGILQFNVESRPELDQLSRVASALGKGAPVALRVNPDVDARTHAKITTGRTENKFGIEIARAPEMARHAASLPGIALIGLAVHIGSQLTSVEPYRAAFERVAGLARDLIAEGHRLRRIDVGGGLGVSYRGETPPDLGQYAASIRHALGELGLGLIAEPGRYLVAPAGVLLARVLYVKEGIAKRFAIIDAAMNDLLRPTLYDAYHGILPVAQAQPGAPLSTYDVVGPVCESGDILAEARALPPLKAGDLIAIETAGAYGAVMASTYNSRPLAPELLVKEGSVAVVRSRETHCELIARDRLPAWLESGGTARLETRSSNKM
jgi:diaminopimelate decarboxylase